MIIFGLKCADCGNGFDGWFRSGEDFDRQTSAALISCPACGSQDVSKGLMAPAVTTSARKAALTLTVDEARHREASRRLRDDAIDVGPEFEREVRRMRGGESGHSAVVGTPTLDEVRRLTEDGIPVFPLHPLPEENN